MDGWSFTDTLHLLSISEENIYKELMTADGVSFTKAAFTYGHKKL